MKWCYECGAVGKPEPAVTTHEGDPLCAGCARARGVTVEKPVFNAEFIDRRMAEHKAEPATPSAPKEKQMATCACGCGGQLKPDSVWNYLRGHKTAHKQGQDVPAPKKAKALKTGEDVMRLHGFTGAQQADVSLVDVVWNALPEAQKKAALRSLLDQLL